METSTYDPYLSAEARDFCFAYLDSLAATQWPGPAEERKAPTSFGSTFVRVSGPPAAPPVLLLHGAASTSLMWAPNVEALSKNYRVFAVDQIGEFGKSLCLKPVASFDHLLAWLDELLTALELPAGVSLVGVSYGGALAVQYALHFPHRLRAIVPLAPANTVLRVKAEFWARLLMVTFARRWGLRSFLRWIFADMQRQNPEWVDAVFDQLLVNMQNLQRRRPVIPPVLTDAEWRSLTVPTLFLMGDRDVIYSARKAVRRLKQVAPQVTAEIVPGAGHDFTVAHAAAVNQRILQFLDNAFVGQAVQPAADCQSACRAEPARSVTRKLNFP